MTTKPYVNVSGTYRPVSNISVNVGGTWKTVSNAYVNVGGTWKQFYQRLFSYTIGVISIADMNLYDYVRANSAWDGTAPLSVTISSGAILSSSSTGVYALTLDTRLPAGCTLINNGSILGRGGTGGAGTFNAGGAGGSALYIGRSISINNGSGLIAGGGGGGGGGGYFADKGYSLGGGGGGGAGYGTGGQGGGQGGLDGAAGGSLTGGAGGVSSENGSSPSAGGYGGYAPAVAGGGGDASHHFQNGADSNQIGGGGGGGGGLGAAGGAGGSGGAGGAPGAATVGYANATWLAVGATYGALN